MISISIDGQETACDTTREAIKAIRKAEREAQKQERIHAMAQHQAQLRAWATYGRVAWGIDTRRDGGKTWPDWICHNASGVPTTIDGDWEESIVAINGDTPFGDLVYAPVRLWHARITMILEAANGAAMAVQITDGSRSHWVTLGHYDGVTTIEELPESWNVAQIFGVWEADI